MQSAVVVRGVCPICVRLPVRVARLPTALHHRSSWAALGGCCAAINIGGSAATVVLLAPRWLFNAANRLQAPTGKSGRASRWVFSLRARCPRMVTFCARLLRLTTFLVGYRDNEKCMGRSSWWLDWWLRVISGFCIGYTRFLSLIVCILNWNAFFSCIIFRYHLFLFYSVESALFVHFCVNLARSSLQVLFLIFRSFVISIFSWPKFLEILRGGPDIYILALGFVFFLWPRFSVFWWFMVLIFIIEWPWLANKEALKIAGN